MKLFGATYSIKEIVEIIRKAYPEKSEEWAIYHWDKCVNNIDVKLTNEVITELLDTEFDIRVENEDMEMKLLVTYENTKTGEYEKYTTTFEELVDSFNGTMNEKIVKKVLKDSGEAILENGYATTTVKVAV